MANRFFEDGDIQPGLETAWRGKVAEELRRRNPFKDLYAAAIYSEPQIYLYQKEHFAPYGAKLVLRMDEDGLGVGFYIERGYLWAADAGWTLQPHWDWHHFLHLLSTSPDFLQTLQSARSRRDDLGFFISSGSADAEELSLHATGLPIATLLGVLCAWPGHLWCDVTFGCHLAGDALVRSSDEGVFTRIIDGLTVVEPIYRAVLARKLEVESRAPAFSGSTQLATTTE